MVDAPSSTDFVVCIPEQSRLPNPLPVIITTRSRRYATNVDSAELPEPVIFSALATALCRAAQAVGYSLVTSDIQIRYGSVRYLGYAGLLEPLGLQFTDDATFAAQLYRARELGEVVDIRITLTDDAPKLQEVNVSDETSINGNPPDVSRRDDGNPRGRGNRKRSVAFYGGKRPEILGL